jgi:ATP-dependent Lhr-like helicase
MAGDRPAGARHTAIRGLLDRRGASFYREVFAAAGGGSDRDVLDALWDLVWAGEVTNDTFAPLRALRWKRPGGDRRPRPGRLATLGPPEAAGRWSRVEPGEATGGEDGSGDVAGPGVVAASSATRKSHALALALLDRHGVLTREAVIAEGVDGGFSGIYPVLRALEESGRIRRGYFVDGLGAAQFALAGAIDRLRAVRDAEGAAPRVDLLAAADPAQPYGAALAWPRRDASDRRPFQRAAGAHVVLVDGAAVLYVERGGKGLVTFPASDDPEVLGSALAALRALLRDGRLRELVISRVDGEPVGPNSAWRDRLARAGFATSYRGMALRAGVAPAR